MRIQATPKLVEYAAKGLHEVDEVQADALKRGEAEMPGGPAMLPVVTGEATSGPMATSFCTAHTEGPRLGEHFTAAVQAEMQRRGGAYERLRKLRADGKVPSYVNKAALCWIKSGVRDTPTTFDLNTGEFGGLK